MSDDGRQLGSMSLMELFQIETEEQARILSDGLIGLEEAPDRATLERLMRAAHSLKGAARIVDLMGGVQVAHAMEDVFVAAQENRIVLQPEGIDLLFAGVDFLNNLSRLTEEEARSQPALASAAEIAGRIAAVLKQTPSAEKPRAKAEEKPLPVRQEEKAAASRLVQPEPAPDAQEHAVGQPPPGAKEPAAVAAGSLMLRISSHGMNRILGLASELKISSRRLTSFSREMLKLKQRQDHLYRTLTTQREELEFGDRPARRKGLQALNEQMAACRAMLAALMTAFDEHGRQTNNLTHRLHQDVLKSKMVPFEEGIHGLGRLARDLGREVGKKIEFSLVGADTPVDRDILHKMESPINHLLRNAVDHGIEPPEQREKTGKPQTGRISLAVFHKSGKLHIHISDDGKGIDVKSIRAKIQAKNMAPEDMLASMSDSELLEFLFLPNFTTREVVSSLSGRGVGLDAVYTAVQEVRGTIRINTELGKGTTFAIKLPLTLSVIRSLLMTIGGEPYALPVVSVEHVLKIDRQEVRHVEGKPYLNFDDKRIGLVSARQIFNLPDRENDDSGQPLSIVILADHDQQYGLLVDSLVGIRDLVVQQLDPRLGKIKDINAASLMEDGTPVLIIDPEDIIRSMDRLIGSGHGATMKAVIGDTAKQIRRNRILVVDDSITVREVEREMLLARGYEVDVAFDGMEAWHMIRNGDFDLVVTDVDMPRWDGIKLLETIRNDHAHRDLPVIIVSYKDREDDRQRGLDAGADYYLTKGSFRDEKLVQAVRELIGDAIRKEQPVGEISA